MYSRISSDSAILGGKPCIRGTRISVVFILELLGSGASRAEIVKSYPQLSIEDVEEATQFAAEILNYDVVLTGEIRP